jgi:hypothetical protein
MGYTSDISWGSYKARTWNAPHLVSYMESHDEERLMYKNLQYGSTLGNYNIKEINTAFNRIELVANFFIPIPGPKMIWQFGELGYDFSINRCPDGAINDDCRVSNKPIRWDYFQVAGRRRIYDVYSALNKLKNTYPVFSTTDYSIVQSGKLKFIYLNSTDMNVVILGNFDMEPKSVIPNFQKTGKWYEFYSGDSITVTSTPGEITLKQGEYRIYTDVKLNKPEITVGFDDEMKFPNGNVMVYPNPSTGLFYFQMMENTSQNLDIKVYNISGQLVLAKSGLEISESIEIDISAMNNGLYFYELSTEAKRFTGRLIKN